MLTPFNSAQNRSHLVTSQLHIVSLNICDPTFTVTPQSVSKKMRVAFSSILPCALVLCALVQLVLGARNVPTASRYDGPLHVTYTPNHLHQEYTNRLTYALRGSESIAHSTPRGYDAAYADPLEHRPFSEEQLANALRYPADVRRFVHLGETHPYDLARGWVVALPVEYSRAAEGSKTFAIVSAIPPLGIAGLDFPGPTVLVHGFSQVRYTPGVEDAIRTAYRSRREPLSAGHTLSTNELLYELARMH